jgi:hypothetical protein
MTKKKTVSTGIVGSGFAAAFHYQALRKVYGTNVEVVGVHSTDEGQGRAYAESCGINFCGALDGLLDEVDAVHFCVPKIPTPRFPPRNGLPQGNPCLCDLFHTSSTRGESPCDSHCFATSW